MDKGLRVGFALPPLNFVTGMLTHFCFVNSSAVLYSVFGLCREQAAAQRTVGILKSSDRGRRDPAAWESSF
jgi:hypothetical protein